MRTTVTLDDDLVAELQRRARERSTSFKEVLNGAVRAGLRPTPPREVAYRLPTRRLGLREGVDLDRAMRLANDLEDDEVVTELERRR
ncbi:ribbon-helix-helix protein, CopG family [Pseudokineococcus basanitobsidens]|uniref:Ribbon-helix-helix protein, CopG family n=1 Tax=Pseudokineococcus basanitobsidens TaxID=1926649 RepID=A0ABU8RGG9_9ACTN